MEGFPIAAELCRKDEYPGTIVYYYEVTNLSTDWWWVIEKKHYLNNIHSKDPGKIFLSQFIRLVLDNISDLNQMDENKNNVNVVVVFVF
jgi:hypothetical protein